MYAKSNLPQNSIYILDTNKPQTHKGKIIKGILSDPTNKNIVGSIPTNYQSIIYSNRNQPAFGTSSNRFLNQVSYFNPEIDLINIKQRKINKWKSHEHFNRKGYGTLISKQQRFFFVNNDNPGPGNYNIKSDFIKKNENLKTCPSQKIDKCNLKQLNTQREKEESESPGPGTYDFFKDKNQNGWRSCFASEVRRMQYLIQNSNPGPGEYQVMERKRTKNQKKIEKQKENKQDQLKKILKNALLVKNTKNIIEYDYEIPDFVPKYQKIKNSPIFMNNLKDRFGQITKQNQQFKNLVQKNTPGPGTYNIQANLSKLIKNKQNTTPFISKSIRDPFKPDQNKLGPNTLRLKKQYKKNFHFNPEKKWL